MHWRRSSLLKLPSPPMAMYRLMVIGFRQISISRIAIRDRPGPRTHTVSRTGSLPMRADLHFRGVGPSAGSRRGAELGGPRNMNPDLTTQDLVNPDLMTPDLAGNLDRVMGLGQGLHRRRAGVTARLDPIGPAPAGALIARHMRGATPTASRTSTGVMPMVHGGLGHRPQRGCPRTGSACQGPGDRADPPITAMRTGLVRMSLAGE